MHPLLWGWEIFHSGAADLRGHAVLADDLVEDKWGVHFDELSVVNIYIEVKI